eukprot:9129576-Pyramimonas_sp.AAC.1
MQVPGPSELDEASAESDLFQEGADQDLSYDEGGASAVVEPPPSGAVEGILAGAGPAGGDGDASEGEDLTDKIVEGVAAAAEDVGLVSAAENPDIGGPAMGAAPPSPDPIRELDGPSEFGYMNYRGRLAGRIVRGKTKGGVHVVPRRRDDQEVAVRGAAEPRPCHEGPED